MIHGEKAERNARRNSGADPLSAGDGRPVLMRQAGKERG